MRACHGNKMGRLDGGQIAEVQIRRNIRGKLTFCQFRCRKGLHLFQKEQSACLTGPVEALRHTGSHGGAETGFLVGNEGRRDGQLWVVIGLFNPLT